MERITSFLLIISKQKNNIALWMRPFKNDSERLTLGLLPKILI
jgi:hypothetical protein